jgi:hypothetical protein
VIEDLGASKCTLHQNSQMLEENIFLIEVKEKIAK